MNSGQKRGMFFELVQSLSLSGDMTVANDDRAGMAHAHAWVIDGATDLGPPGLVGPRGGAAWLALEADAAFAAAGDAPVETICAGVFARLARRFDAVRTREALARWELPVAAFLLVRLSDAGLECVWAGDCMGLLRRGASVERLGPPADIRDKEAESAASMAEHGLGKVKTDRAAPVLDHLRASRGNTDKPLLGTDPEAAKRLAVMRTACAPGDDLLLMTDGFAALIDSYAALDAETLMAALDTGGLPALATRLRAIEAEDADCTHFPRFKRSDDATALWVRVSG